MEEKSSDDNSLVLAYMNIKGQTGLDLSKQKQIEHILMKYKIDILNWQEINIDENSFTQFHTELAFLNIELFAVQ